MNLEISFKTQNVRSFNLSENGLFSMKKKIQAVMFEGDDILCLTNTQNWLAPQVCPLGAPPGTIFFDDCELLKVRNIDLSDRYDMTILRSQAGVCISYRSCMTKVWSTRLKALLMSTQAARTACGFFWSSVDWTKLSNLTR